MRTPGHLRKIALPLAALGLVFIGPCGPGPAPPDVVIVVVDSLRPDLIGPMGEMGQAPRLTGLADESVVFEDVSYSGLETSTAVKSLLTGQHPLLLDLGQSGQEPTLVEMLSDRGYVTGSLRPGKESGRSSDIEQGFEFTSTINLSGEEASPTRNLLNRMEGRPYLLLVQSTDLHDQPQFGLQLEGESGRGLINEYDRMISARRTLAGPREVSAEGEVQERLLELRPRVHALYGEALRSADNRIGMVVDQLRARGTWERTLFIVISDPGRPMTESGGYEQPTPVYQEQMHAYLLVRFPKGRFGGRRVSTPVSALDVLPTVLEAVGAPVHNLDISGVSLVPATASSDPLTPRPRLMAIHSTADRSAGRSAQPVGGVKLVIREGAYKAILDLEMDSTSLFDLLADPGETQDLAGELPQRAFRLSKHGAEAYVDLVSRN